MSQTTTTQATARLDIPAVEELVAGGWTAPGDRLDLVVEDNFAGTPLGAAPASASDAVEAALVAAAAVHAEQTWAGIAVAERAEILDAIGTALESEVPRLAALEAFATGAPVAQTGIVGVIVPGAFHLAAEMLRAGALLETKQGPGGHAVEVHRLPLGPAVCLVPWNAPAPMAAHKVASSLAAGAPTILKPSEFAPYGTTELARIIDRVLSDAGAPAGVFQLLQGGAGVGGALVTDPRTRAVSFTGGLVAGRQIASACAGDFTALQLELGGNNPLVVLPDADPDDAARAATDLLTTLNGQWCRALGRLVVPESMAEAVLAGILDRLAELKAGDPLDPATQLGPLVHSSHRANLQAAIAERLAASPDAVAHARTEIPATGSFMAPTLLTGVPSEAALHEMFGPVATVHSYRSLDEALSLANDTPFGLEGYVFGKDTEAALGFARQVRAGEVKVNGSSIMSLHLMTPRPAWGWSGMGEEGTVETIHTFTGARVVGIEGGFALHAPE